MLASMFGLGFGELLILAAIIFLLFGAKRLPGLGKAMGRSLGEFKKGMDEKDDSSKDS